MSGKESDRVCLQLSTLLWTRERERDGAKDKVHGRMRLKRGGAGRCWWAWSGKTGNWKVWCGFPVPVVVSHNRIMSPCLFQLHYHYSSPFPLFSFKLILSSLFPFLFLWCYKFSFFFFNISFFSLLQTKLFLLSPHNPPPTHKYFLKRLYYYYSSPLNYKCELVTHIECFFTAHFLVKFLC